MNRIVILKKAFEKAEKNGYKISLPSGMGGKTPMSKVIEYGIYYKFLFNHDFAKAFFLQVFTGGKLVVRQDYYLDCLAEMAREEDPIKYLEKYL